jgi:hypothetical protein
MAKTPLEIASLARMHTKKAVKTLAAIMNEPHAPYAARVAAAEALLDRGWGKPRQSHEAEITHHYLRRAPDPLEWPWPTGPNRLTLLLFPYSFRGAGGMIGPPRSPPDR